jgi:caffeoyl-CoA O-methyltransferase
MTAAPRPVTPLGILAATLQELAAEAGADPRLLRAAALADGLDPYVEAHTTPASNALAALDARTRAHPWAGRLEQEMLSGHVEGQLLRFLVRMSRARRVLDIGMFTGYSALAMAEALPDDGGVVACELDAEVARFAQRCFALSPAGDRIDVRVGPAAATLAQLDDRFDLVFIDADKAGYLGYVDAVLERDLLAPGGLIAVDNTLMQGQPWTGEPTPNGQAIAAFNAAVAADPRLEHVLLAVRDGITLIQRA